MHMTHPKQHTYQLSTYFETTPSCRAQEHCNIWIALNARFSCIAGVFGNINFMAKQTVAFGKDLDQSNTKQWRHYLSAHTDVTIMHNPENVPSSVEWVRSVLMTLVISGGIVDAESGKSCVDDVHRVNCWQFLLIQHFFPGPPYFGLSRHIGHILQSYQFFLLSVAWPLLDMINRRYLHDLAGAQKYTTWIIIYIHSL